MIINIRGTSGSGKSTLVRSVMDKYEGRQVIFTIPGRKRPSGYLLTSLKSTVEQLFIPGSYENPTGGCDTIPKIDLVYEMIEMARIAGHDILFEGIMIGDDVKRCAALNKLSPVLVIALNTPIETCLRGIQNRRDARGDERPLCSDNTVERDKRLRRSMMPRLKDAGVETVWLGRDDALALTLARLGF